MFANFNIHSHKQWLYFESRTLADDDDDVHDDDYDDNDDNDDDASDVVAERSSKFASPVCLLIGAQDNDAHGDHNEQTE